MLKGVYRIVMLLAICSIPRGVSAQTKPLLDNDRIHVHETTIKVGVKSPEHTHPANEATYVLSGGKLKVTLSDGTVTTLELKTGDIAWRSTPEKHVVENVGDAELRLLIIQLKDSSAPTSKTP